jgi:hypothetical protein
MEQTGYEISVHAKGARARFRKIDAKTRAIALRTAFVSRFIVLREGRRSRAHRTIEELKWDNTTTAKDLYKVFLQAFIDNGDKLEPVKRDLDRAFSHAERSVDYFVDQYYERANCSFVEALLDYQKSNTLLFGDDVEDIPRSGGWRFTNDRKPK